MAYRSWSERRDIIRSVIADSNPPPLATFNLSKSEEIFFRARSQRAVTKLARQTSEFKAYYALPRRKPFALIVAISGAVAISAVSAATYIFYHTRNNPAYPVIAALVSLTVVAMGWAVAGWITHRNTIRQNTNNMLFARFSQAPFIDALHRFHMEFGQAELPRVTRGAVLALRETRDEDKWKAATSVGFLLNYFEIISNGLLRGDLDPQIVRDNIRGVICFYYDKCEPYIADANRRNPRTFEHLIKVRTHYREP